MAAALALEAAAARIQGFDELANAVDNRQRQAPPAGKAGALRQHMMSTCPSCGKDNPSGRPRCGDCGSKLPVASDASEDSTDLDRPFQALGSVTLKKVRKDGVDKPGVVARPAGDGAATELDLPAVEFNDEDETLPVHGNGDLPTASSSGTDLPLELPAIDTGGGSQSAGPAVDAGSGASPRGLSLDLPSDLPALGASPPQAETKDPPLSEGVIEQLMDYATDGAISAAEGGTGPAVAPLPPALPADLPSAKIGGAPTLPDLPSLPGGPADSGAGPSGLPVLSLQSPAPSNEEAALPPPPALDPADLPSAAPSASSPSELPTPSSSTDAPAMAELELPEDDGAPLELESPLPGAATAPASNPASAPNAYMPPPSEAMAPPPRAAEIVLGKRPPGATPAPMGGLPGASVGTAGSASLDTAVIGSPPLPPPLDLPGIVEAIPAKKSGVLSRFSYALKAPQVAKAQREVLSFVGTNMSRIKRYEKDFTAALGRAARLHAMTPPGIDNLLTAAQREDARTAGAGPDGAAAAAPPPRALIQIDEEIGRAVLGAGAAPLALEQLTGAIRTCRDRVAEWESLQTAQQSELSKFDEGRARSGFWMLMGGALGLIAIVAAGGEVIRQIILALES